MWRCTRQATSGGLDTTSRHMKNTAGRPTGQCERSRNSWSTPAFHRGAHCSAEVKIRDHKDAPSPKAGGQKDPHAKQNATSLRTKLKCRNRPTWRCDFHKIRPPCTIPCASPGRSPGEPASRRSGPTKKASRTTTRRSCVGRINDRATTQQMPWVRDGTDVCGSTPTNKPILRAPSLFGLGTAMSSKRPPDPMARCMGLRGPLLAGRSRVRTLRSQEGCLSRRRPAALIVISRAFK